MKLDAFSSLIETIYQTALDPAGWPRLIDRISHAFAAESSVLGAWDARNGARLLEATTGNYTQGVLDDYAEHYRAMDIWLQRDMARTRYQPRIGSELISDAELLGTEFYNDFLRRVGNFDALGCLIGPGPATEAFIAIHRPRGTARFGPEDKQRLSLLVPHLSQALRLHERLAGAQRTGTVASAALDAMPTGVLAVAADGRVLFANSIAERLLAQGRGLTVRLGRLHCTDQEADRLLDRLVGQAGLAALGRAPGAGGVLPAPRPPARPLSLLVCPRRPEALALGPLQPLVLIFVGNPDERPPTSAEILGRLYAFTPAEARLAEALLAGDTLADFAARQNISMNTVKTQLKQIFAKTGATRQAELIRDLLGNPVLAMAGRGEARR